MPPVVLVVEDEPIVSKYTCRCLEEAGFRCIAAETAMEAWALVQGGTVPEVMVLDIRLPDVPGPALALRIHQLHPHIPALFVSGWVDGLADPHTLGDMRWEFLQKPFKPEDLVAGVRRLLPAQAATG